MANEPLPPLILSTGQPVPNLLQKSRQVRNFMMDIFSRLEEESLREKGKGRLELWASASDANYLEFLKLLSKNMPREVEQQGPDTVEALLKQLDERARNAKIVPAHSPSPPPPSSSE